MRRKGISYVQEFKAAHGSELYPRDDRPYANLLAAALRFPGRNKVFWLMERQLPETPLREVFEIILAKMEESHPEGVRVLRLRYGLMGGEDRILTLGEVAERIGLGQGRGERVRQLEAIALRRINFNHKQALLPYVLWREG